MLPIQQHSPLTPHRERKRPKIIEIEKSGRKFRALQPSSTLRKEAALGRNSKNMSYHSKFTKRAIFFLPLIEM